jgi:alternate signal-mediated exported protein
LTKAAIATGIAAVLLLGGAGTIAYWTGTGSATGTAVTSGELTVTGGTCAAWTYAASDGGGAITDVVPGDTLQTVCSITVSGTGDHLGVTATLDASSAAFGETNPLVSALTLSEGAVEVDGEPVPDTGDGISISGGATHTVSVEVTASFAYGDATATALNNTQNLTATLNNITINVVQTHIAP